MTSTNCPRCNPEPIPGESMARGMGVVVFGLCLLALLSHWIVYRK